MFRVYDEDGTPFDIDDIKTFCDLYNLNVDELTKLIYGESIIYNGFHNGVGFDCRSKIYELYDRNNELVVIKNMAKFCRENNLVYQSMIHVNNGVQKTHRGWSKKITNGGKVYELYNPEGKLFIINNMTDFCRENGLNYQSIVNVNHGKQKQHKGWSRSQTVNVIKTFSLVKPDGDVVVIDNLTKFCNHNKLSYQSIMNVIHGKQKQHKGWKSA